MAIYNEYRPLTLEQVRGQDIIKNQLKAMFESGSVPNALLFVGPRGTGKTTIARIVARFMNCEAPQGDPCNSCKSCKEILAGTSSDVLELDAASNNKVEDVRGIIENAQYAPIGKTKVYILDEVHMFSQGAWNALLKILEEPPKDVLFILCTTEEQKIPATIVSRCRKMYFERVELGEIVEFMEDICEEKGVAYDKDALLLIARASEGCVRDALSILESFLDVDAVVVDNVAKTLGLSGEDAVFNILEGVVTGNATAAIGSLKEATGRGVSLSGLVKSLIGAVSDALFIKQGADIKAVLNTALYKKRLAKFIEVIDSDRALELIGCLSEIYGSISKTPDAGFLVESSLLKAVQYESELGKLRERINALEKRVAEGVVAQPAPVSVSVAEMPAPTEQPIQAETSEADSPVADKAGADWEPVDDVCPFDEDPEPEFFGSSVPVAPVPEPVTVENISATAPAPAEQTEPADDVFASFSGELEVGEAVDLFATSEETGAPAEAAQPVAEPESEPECEPYIKVGAAMPTLNVGSMAGFLWQ